VERHQKNYVWFGVKVQHVLNHEDEVIEGHEADDSDEMRVDELPAAYLPIRHQFL